jgi:hypothetical protein
MTRIYAADADGRAVLVHVVERPLAEVQAERVAELQRAIREHVDAHLPPSEREALSALLQRATLMRGMGLPVDDGALLAPLAALGWAEDAMVLGGDIARRCAECTTVEELRAVDVDPAKALGQPPIITAGDIAAALRGANVG